MEEKRHKVIHIDRSRMYLDMMWLVDTPCGIGQPICGIGMAAMAGLSAFITRDLAMCCDDKSVIALMGACTVGYGLISGSLLFDSFGRKKTEMKDFCDNYYLDKKDFKRLKKTYKKDYKAPFSINKGKYFYKELDDIYEEKGYIVNDTTIKM